MQFLALSLDLRGNILSEIVLARLKHEMFNTWYHARKPLQIDIIFKVPMTRNFTPKVHGCIVKIT